MNNVGTSRSRGPVHSSKQEITETLKFLTWLHEAHAKHLPECNQQDVEQYLAGGPTTRHLIRTFFVWADRAHLKQDIVIGHRTARTTRAITQDDRLAWIRALLTGDDESLPYRIAGVLLLLYAQPLVRVAGLRPTPSSAPPTAWRSPSAPSTCPSRSRSVSSVNMSYDDPTGAEPTPTANGSSPARGQEATFTPTPSWTGCGPAASTCSAPATPPYDSSSHNYHHLSSPPCSATAPKSPTSAPQLAPSPSAATPRAPVEAHGGTFRAAVGRAS